MYDSELGPLARQFAYGFFLQAKNRQYWDGLLCHEQGWWWHILYFFMGGYVPHGHDFLPLATLTHPHTPHSSPKCP
jgi:hypothetical protein